MRILYAIQGTGNGHLSRAFEMVPAFRRRSHLSVDVLISGSQAELRPSFGIDYHRRGLGFVFGRRGGIDFRATWQQASFTNFISEVRELPIHEYDLVVNDFEPVSAWAARRAGIPCLALSHQHAIWASGAPRPNGYQGLRERFTHWYAPTSGGVGFHYKRYDKDIFHPIIKSEFRRLSPREGEHITVYLPAYDDEVLENIFRAFPKRPFEVFSKRCRQPYVSHNVHFYPVGQDTFTDSMLNAWGVICGAGFETPSEALFLGKRLLVVPMRHQFEQACNATALADLGVPVIKHFDEGTIPTISAWLRTKRGIRLSFPEETDQVVERILAYAPSLQEISTEAYFPKKAMI